MKDSTSLIMFFPRRSSIRSIQLLNHNYKSNFKENIHITLKFLLISNYTDFYAMHFFVFLRFVKSSSILGGPAHLLQSNQLRIQKT